MPHLALYWLEFEPSLKSFPHRYAPPAPFRASAFGVLEPGVVSSADGAEGWCVVWGLLPWLSVGQQRGTGAHLAWMSLGGPDVSDVGCSGPHPFKASSGSRPC